ncbi:MAG: aminopeptidase [Lachnospiraceae bacterium]|nr:aminopeptidase [Lachnospiraceae bacterium]
MENTKQAYAELVIKEGINIQKGQRLVINCPVECADFAKMCAKAAYENGCREVIMRWNDDTIARLKYLYADSDVFDKVDPWDEMFSDKISEEGAAWLAIYAEDPENLKGVDPDRINRFQVSRGKATAKFREREMRNEFQWCVCSVPTVAWSKAVFPQLSEDEAVDKLWEEILKACRADKGDAVSNWRKHSEELKKHVEILNGFNFKSLHYTNSLGTDLHVELPEDHFWAGGDEASAKGVMFSANIPTEEVFTLPKKNGVNGVVYSSRPFCLNGNIIKDFYFVIKDGKIVEAHAKEGEAILKDAISVDEGASYFGEVALVPFDSPISDSGILFLNTLFDENASCHIAFGEAYPCIKGAETMSMEELAERGVNSSMTHEDFMVGTRDLSIIGTTHDGKEIPVFVNGNFAF